MRLIAFRISQHSERAASFLLLVTAAAAAKVRSLICMGNGAFMRLLTVSQNDYIFHRLHDYRIAMSSYVNVAASNYAIRWSAYRD